MLKSRPTLSPAPALESSTIAKIGKIPLEQALTLPSQRLGRKLDVKVTKPVKLPKHYGERLAASRNRTSDMSDRMKKIAASVEQQAILPDYIALTAALAFAYGLDKASLGPWLKAAHALQDQMKKLKSQAYLGNVKRLIESANQDLFARIADLLSQSPTALTATDIAKRLNTKVKFILNSFGVLEAMGLAVKFPFLADSEKKGNQILWGQADRLEQVLGLEPNNFMIFRVLQALKHGKPMETRQLAKAVNLESSVSSVHFQACYLADAELITIKDALRHNKTARGRAKTFHVNVHQITNQGKKVLAEQKRLSYLHETLRRAWFGETTSDPVEALSAGEQLTLMKVVNFVKLRLAYEDLVRDETGRVLNGQAKDFAQANRLRKKQLGAIRGFSYTPFSSISEEKIRARYLPALDKLEPEVSAWIFNALKTGLIRTRKSHSVRMAKKATQASAARELARVAQILERSRQAITVENIKERADANELPQKAIKPLLAQYQRAQKQVWSKKRKTERERTRRARQKKQRQHAVVQAEVMPKLERGVISNILEAGGISFTLLTPQKGIVEKFWKLAKLHTQTSNGQAVEAKAQVADLEAELRRSEHESVIDFFATSQYRRLKTIFLERF